MDCSFASDVATCSEGRRFVFNDPDAGSLHFLADCRTWKSSWVNLDSGAAECSITSAQQPGLPTLIAVLDSVTYANTDRSSHTNAQGVVPKKLVTYQVTEDHGGDGVVIIPAGAIEHTFDFEPVNDPPVLSAANQGPVFVTSTFESVESLFAEGLDLDDIDSDSISKATVTIEPRVEGEKLSITLAAPGLTVSEPASNRLELSTTAAVGTYRAALRSVALTSTKTMESIRAGFDRVVTISVEDEEGARSNETIVEMRVVPSNEEITFDTPVRESLSLGACPR